MVATPQRHADTTIIRHTYVIRLTGYITSLRCFDTAFAITTKTLSHARVTATLMAEGRAMATLTPLPRHYAIAC